MHFGIIYKITDLSNNKVYVGQTTKPLIKRWKQHVTNCHGKRSISLLFRAISKRGEASFSREVIEVLQADSVKELTKLLDASEQRHIALNNSKAPNGYNLSDGGVSTKGFKFSEQSKKRLSDAHRGQTAWNTGKKLSPAHCESLRVAHLKHHPPTPAPNLRWCPYKEHFVDISGFYYSKNGNPIGLCKQCANERDKLRREAKSFNSNLNLPQIPPPCESNLGDMGQGC